MIFFKIYLLFVGKYKKIVWKKSDKLEKVEKVEKTDFLKKTLCRLFANFSVH